MPSNKLSVLPDLAGLQAPADLVYVVDVSAGVTGSKRSTLNDLFAFITKNITDGAVRFQEFAAPALSAANQGALYFDAATDRFRVSENGGAYVDLLNGGVIGRTVVGGTVGSVLFVGAGGLLAQDNANLFWSDGNDSLGVRAATPAARLHVHANVGESMNPSSGGRPVCYFGVPSSSLNPTQQAILEGGVVQIASKDNSGGVSRKALVVMQESDTGTNFFAGGTFALFDTHTSNPGGAPTVLAVDALSETLTSTAETALLSAVRARSHAGSNGIVSTLVGVDATARALNTAGQVIEAFAVKAVARSENGSNTSIFDAIAADLVINKPGGTISFAVFLDVGFNGSSISGNCNELVGLWINSFNSFTATTKVAIRTSGPERLEFGGRCIIGEAGSRAASEISLQVSSPPVPTAQIAQFRNNTTPVWELWPAPWQVQAEAATDPGTTQLVAGNHFSLYRKNDKLVIAYNNAGTITYLTIPLDAATTTWTQSTTAP